MSGGHFEYKDSALRYEIFGYGDTIKNPFEDIEISRLVYDVLELIHAYDWYKSGDTDESDYISEKNKFKDKWLKRDKERTKEIIDSVIAEARNELYKTFCLETETSDDK